MTATRHGVKKLEPADDGLTQTERFLQAARDLDCDEDKDRFEAKLGAIARQKPAPGPKEKRLGKNPSRK